jgi:exonuclease III
MRLVSWNCKGAFHQKHDAISELRPDVLIVPECERLSDIPQALGSAPVMSFEWFGTNPRKGLAVLSYGDYTFELHPSYDPRHRWIVPVSVSGPISFLLFAVWTVPHSDSRSYVHPLFEAFEHYKSLIETSDAIWAGDFNASFAFDRPSRRYKFRDFVSLLDRYGFRSLYHEQRGCQHGDEPEDTFYLYHHAERGFHIDYMFASNGFQPSTFSLSVGSHVTWMRRSDHVPLICELHEQRLTNLSKPTAGRCESLIPIP